VVSWRTSTADMYGGAQDGIAFAERHRFACEIIGAAGGDVFITADAGVAKISISYRDSTNQHFGVHGAGSKAGASLCGTAVDIICAARICWRAYRRMCAEKVSPSRRLALGVTLRACCSCAPLCISRMLASIAFRRSSRNITSAGV